MESPRTFFALIVTPTRELALQIKEQVRALGAAVGVRCACLVGGAGFREQALQLGSSQPHVVIGTPGRLVDHVESTQGLELQLRKVRFLVLDEADRLLGADFELQLSKLLCSLPKRRCTLLFSASMTSKVAKLQRASLHDPVRAAVSLPSRTVAALRQFYLLLPQVKRDCGLLLLLRSRFAACSSIVFVDTCADSMRLALTLSYAGLPALPLNGRMPQNRRLAALNKFRAEGGCLVATDVASRGLDIPRVDAVLLYSAPGNVKDYVHRVGRTARAGKAGQAVTLVTQYDVANLQLIERALGQQLPALEVEAAELSALLQEVREADQVVRKVRCSPHTLPSHPSLTPLPSHAAGPGGGEGLNEEAKCCSRGCSGSSREEEEEAEVSPRRDERSVQAEMKRSRRDWLLCLVPCACLPACCPNEHVSSWCSFLSRQSVKGR